MTIQLNTIIDRPITDARHFTSVLLAEPNVKHAWSLIQGKAYSDPASSVGGLKMPSRLPGGVPLQSWSPTPDHRWETRGGFVVSAYPPVEETGTNGVAAWKAEIPNPGPVFSAIVIAKHPAGFREPLAIDYADLNLQFVPHRSQFRAINAYGTSGTPTGSFDMGPPAPDNAWNATAFVVDFTNKQFASSVNGDAFVTVDVAELEAQSDATATVAVGRGLALTAGSQNFDGGSISDIIILSGDVRNNPAFLSHVETYNATGYAV